MNAIRRAFAADAAGLARIHVACWHESYDGLVPPQVLAAFTLERGLAVWAKILAEPSAFNAAAVYVAQGGGQIIGFASCGSQRSARLAALGYDAEVSSIYLLRAFQRQGRGAALLHCLAKDLLARHFKAVSLWVLRDNSRARGFYERCGGRRVAERTDVREHTELLEVAYGWSSLEDLAGRTADPTIPPVPGPGA